MKTETTGVRLQKFLADAGLASRRKAEEIIQSGRVRVNGEVVTELGTKVDPSRDLVVVDGAPVQVNEARRYILLYKPPGCVTTLSDPQGRPTARGYLQAVKERVFPVGRLDYDAEGALLFTDDGELANRLAHPSFGHKRIYLVKTKGDPDPKALRRMVEGVRLEDGPARALQAEVHEKVEKNTWVRIVVGEGRNHLVKRLCEAVGLPVLRLFRPEFGGVTVERLRPGHWRDLTEEELGAVRHAAGLSGGVPTPRPSPEDLPKAGRRHGHGPPPQREPSRQQPADRRREELRAAEEEAQARPRGGGRGTGRSGAAGAGRGAGRPGEHGSRGERGGLGDDRGGRFGQRGAERRGDRPAERGGDRRGGDDRSAARSGDRGAARGGDRRGSQGEDRGAGRGGPRGTARPAGRAGPGRPPRRPAGR